jgi:hypothetical protein
MLCVYTCAVWDSSGHNYVFLKGSSFISPVPARYINTDWLFELCWTTRAYLQYTWTKLQWEVRPHLKDHKHAHHRLSNINNWWRVMKFNIGGVLHVWIRYWFRFHDTWECFLNLNNCRWTFTFPIILITNNLFGLPNVFRMRVTSWVITLLHSFYISLPNWYYTVSFIMNSSFLEPCGNALICPHSVVLFFIYP